MIEELEIMLEAGAIAPTRAWPTDAGLDLYCPERVHIWPQGRVKINTGVHVRIPDGYVGEMEPKSGLMANDGVLCAGTIDASYRGPIHAVLFNLSDHVVTFERGQKIAQLVIYPIETPKVRVVDSLPETERGDGGFGSTGK